MVRLLRHSLLRSSETSVRLQVFSNHDEVSDRTMPEPRGFRFVDGLFLRTHEQINVSSCQTGHQ